MTNDLKPCPFCGGIAHITKSYDPDGFGAFHHAQCRKCRAKGTEYFARETCPIFFEQVRAAWNTRAKTKAADALEADLCAVVKPLTIYAKTSGYCYSERADTGEKTANVEAWIGDDRAWLSLGFMDQEPIPDILGKKSDDILEYINDRWSKEVLSAITIRSASDVAAEARAGAIEAAALECEEITKPTLPPSYFGGRGGDVYDAGQSAACKSKATAIRALHDADTLASIERIKEQARQEERERCATIAQDFGCCHVPAEIAKAIREDEW